MDSKVDEESLLNRGDQSVKSSLSFSHIFDVTEDSTLYKDVTLNEAELLCTSPEEAISTSLPNQVGSASFSTMFVSGQTPLDFDNSLTVSGDNRALLSISRGGFPSNFKIEIKNDLPPESLPERGITVPRPSIAGDTASMLPSSYGTSYTNLSECEVILNDGTKARRKITLSTSSGFQSKKKPEFPAKYDERSPLISKQAPSLSSGDYPSSENPSSYWDRVMNALPTLTLSRKAVIKSTLSYFCGSLLTFIPAMRGIIGSSSHMAAISGFFLNPGQSIGKFVESMAFGILFVAYGLAVGYMSLANMAFWNAWGYPFIARSSTLFLFIGVASFILAFIKAQYPKPTVVKCIPNAFIFIYIVLINYTPFVETTFDPFKIYDLAKTLFSGILLNFIICTQLWPRWEADKLRDDMGATLDSFRISLASIVKTFLLEETENAEERDIDKIMAAHRKGFQTLKQRYEAAQWEFYFEPDRYMRLGKVVDRFNRLSQKLGGLSSGIDAQKDLLEDMGMDLNSRFNSNRRQSKFPKFKSDRLSKMLGADSADLDKPAVITAADPGLEPEPDVEVLFHFLRLVSPPTKALTYTCKQAIFQLMLAVEGLNKTAGMPDSSGIAKEGFNPVQLRENISSALELFSKAQSKAMSTLYRRTRYDGRPDEEIFLVYFFVFSLEEFATELILCISAFEEMAQAPAPEGSKWWNDFRTPFSALWMVVRSLATRGIEHMSWAKPTSKSHDIVEPLHNPSTNTVWQWLSARFWYFLMALRDHRVVFAGKCSFVAILVASPCYLADYRDLFVEWRVGWTLITINLVMSPTIGASNLYGIYRSLGTLAGSAAAYVVYFIFSHDAIALSIVSTLIAIPCMYIFLSTSIPRFGQFFLLSYNLIVLTTYANRHDVEFSFAHYAFVRTFSVLVGVLIGLLFSSLVLPFEARRELRMGLSKFFLEVSGLYQRLVEMYSIPSPAPGSPHFVFSFGNEDPIYALSVNRFLELEFDLQLQLLDLGALLTHTTHEPRLKGPFPMLTYRKILQSCQILLDKFVAMRIVITKDEWQDRVRKDFVVPLNSFRADLVGNIILYFYILASALHLKSPLPPYLPPAALARRRLVTALRDLPVVRNRFLHQDDDHHIVYYAFIVVLDDIISELDELGILFKSLYGSQGDAAFNELFRG